MLIRWTGMAIIATARSLGLILAIALLLTSLSAGAEGDQPEFTYRANVNEVRLSFSAMDQNDHGVATLQASDFAVVDKGFIVRDFQSFTRSNWTALEIAILVDTSDSVTPHFRQEISDTVELLSQTAGVPDENISMFSFQNQKPTQLCAGDCRASHAAERLAPTRTGGLTPLFDSLIVAANYLSQHADAHAQKILILFSDGEDTISRHSAADAIDIAIGSDIQIDSIGLRGSDSASRGDSTLRGLAAATGGRAFSGRDGAIAAAQAILENFRATYTVTYRLPTHAAGFHLVQILPTHNLKLQFHNRSGYFYPNRAQ
jgi:VWFA-related protein